jgi:dipeptidase
VTANTYVIGEIDLEDSFNFLGTPIDQMIQHAKNANLTPIFGESGLLNFKQTFSSGEYHYKYYSGRRQWRTFSLLSPELSLTLSPTYSDLLTSYPFSLPTKKSISAQDLIGVHRDWFGNNPWLANNETSEFDL